MQIINKHDPIPSSFFNKDNQPQQQQSTQQEQSRPQPKFKVYTMPKKYMFIKTGPHGEEIYRVTQGTRIYYLKKNLTVAALNNYQLAFSIGVGPNTKCDFARKIVEIEEGANLAEAITAGMILQKDVHTQLYNLRKELEKNKVAHCDVKYANCLYFPSVQKILLIDNGDMTSYGQHRPVRTRGQNTTLFMPSNVAGETSKYTDRKGFKGIIEYLNKHCK